jgi:hypothetical protein
MKPPVSNATTQPLQNIRAEPLLKQGVSSDARRQVLELRRSHSLSEVAAKTGLPLGTVKTICARSGAFKDNPRLRELFTLPAIQTSTSTELAVPMLPPESTVTGDKDIDAVLWLREVIKTGRADLINKAMLAAKRIKTPLKDLEKRYLDHLTAKNPGNWTAAFQTFGFADLEALAQSSTQKLTRKNEALARFGTVDTLFSDTPAELFSIDALAGLKPSKDFGDLDDKQVDARFNARPDLMPNTLSDCLHEMAYWRDLYTLRHSHSGGDQGREAYARECFAFRCLAHIKPKTKPEAVAVFRYLADSERMDDRETESILLNLIG